MLGRPGPHYMTVNSSFETLGQTSNVVSFLTYSFQSMLSRNCRRNKCPLMLYGVRFGIEYVRSVGLGLDRGRKVLRESPDGLCRGMDIFSKPFSALLEVRTITAVNIIEEALTIRAETGRILFVDNIGRDKMQTHCSDKSSQTPAIAYSAYITHPFSIQTMLSTSLQGVETYRLVASYMFFF